ncbi:ribonuclease Z [Kribbella sp. VKM Ac-2566]|uniref:ribonuclease Z n=1 Tax=Kribbella sp. VKM Ac-2566 TaxID=2512218 RepID=UPI001062C726|nr:ribonuclease Z [Kribbella sp. VKM Ac-2566]TDW91046.1 RNAse Z [Kribbella sp. VKM Ac-2566]
MRELVVLGTGSQVPSRERTQNGYFLRWDDEGFLFDPGEGTQRQMIYAGLAAGTITRLCVTHFHGDHCLGVPGVVQRLSLDDVPHPVRAHYPASGQTYFTRLRYAASFFERAELLEEPVEEDGLLSVGSFGQLWARRLEHPIESFGYQLIEPDGRRMLPDKLAAYGVTGPDVGRLQRAGSLDLGDRTVRVEDVSELRVGQRFAFIMDTRLCENVLRLADGADLLVIESTYLSSETELARRFGHLTARQAARVAEECGVRKLVLTHFSQRYLEPERFHEEAAAEFSGEIVVASDLTRTSVPSRR